MNVLKEQGQDLTTVVEDLINDDVGGGKGLFDEVGPPFLFRESTTTIPF